MSEKWDNDFDGPAEVNDDRKAAFDAQGDEMMDDMEWGELGGAAD